MLFLILFSIVVFIIIAVAVSLQERNSVSSYEHDSVSSYEETRQRYQISASVPYSFYNDVQNYCHHHNMTVSDLVRNSVKDYMKSSAPSSSMVHNATSSTTDPQPNYSSPWKCPRCGRVNASYVGTCACGKLKYSDS